MDKYIKFSAVMEYLRSRNDEARKCGHEETYYDLLTIIDGLKNVETIPASALDKDTNIPNKWIPVTPDTMPEKNRVVVVCGEKGTWDYGTYRGHLNSINNWIWKKNTVKTVCWWMYKEDALPMPWEGE